MLVRTKGNRLFYLILAMMNFGYWFLDNEMVALLSSCRVYLGYGAVAGAEEQVDGTGATNPEKHNYEYVDFNHNPTPNNRISQGKNIVNLLFNFRRMSTEEWKVYWPVC